MQPEEKSQTAIKALYAKYSNNTFMLDKLTNYIVEQLPTVMANIEKTNTQRIQRVEELTQEQNVFVNGFLSKQQYFYAPGTEYFFTYNGKNYANISEDEIIHNILSSISRDRTLISWKQKTKSIIIKKIKENIITASIPDSATIQNVLSSIYPSIFSTKAEAKYFLTVLGDNIFKKTESFTLIHLLPSTVKQWINQLNVACQLWFGTNLNQSFKYKYHQDHVYSTLRLLSPMGAHSGGWNYSHLLDLLCVACHYSNRYGGSENFLTTFSNDDAFIKSVRFLQNKTPHIVVDEFVQSMIVSTASGCISWKNMQFLWKLYLNKQQLPNILSLSQLKTGLSALEYDATNDCFNGYTSKYLPAVYDFLQFWDTTMKEDETEIELEIGEIAVLFKQWNRNVGMSEADIFNVLQHFHPEIEIDQQKFIYKWKCNLWDKAADIETALIYINTDEQSVYDCYQKYCNIAEKKTLKVSKQYFEKFMALKQHLDKET